MALETNLFSYWKFDESSGNAADAIGSNTLTNNGTITYSAGKINNGANLASASSQYFSAADSASLSVTGNFTMAFWIKPTATPANNGGYYLIMKSRGAASNRSYELLYTNPSNVPTLSISVYGDGTNTNYAISNLVYTLSTSSWTHVVITCTMSNPYTSKFIWYINGVSQGNGSTGYSGTDPSSIYDGTEPLTIGQAAPDNIYAPYYYNGSIDEFGFWSRAISSSEVTLIYGAGYGSTIVSGSFVIYGYQQSYSDTSSTTDTTSVIMGQPVSVSDSSAISDNIVIPTLYSYGQETSTTWTNSSKT